jgi:acetolactate synthase-1/2/3 large subunit
MDIRVESLADRVPPVYSWLNKKGRDPLALKPEDVAYL